MVGQCIMDMLNVIAPIVRIGFRTLGGDFPPCPSLLQPLITVQEPGENILAAIKLTGSCSLKGSLYGSSQLPCFPLSHSWSFANENNVQCIYSCLEKEFTDACVHKVYACKKKLFKACFQLKCLWTVQNQMEGYPCHSQTYSSVFLEEMLGGLELAALWEPFLKLCRHGMNE